MNHSETISGAQIPFLPTVPRKAVAVWRRDGVTDGVGSACVVGGLRVSGPPPRDWRYWYPNKTISQEIRELKRLAAEVPDKTRLQSCNFPRISVYEMGMRRVTEWSICILLYSLVRRLLFNMLLHQNPKFIPNYVTVVFHLPP